MGCCRRRHVVGRAWPSLRWPADAPSDPSAKPVRWGFAGRFDSMGAPGPMHYAEGAASGSFAMDVEQTNAVAGAVGFLGPEVEDAVHGMVEALSHRAGGGARASRVDTLPRSAMLGPQDGAGLAFDGAIYNGAELCRELERCGQSLASSLEGELLLKAHRVWGGDFVTRLEGMFALALWDPGERTLLLARDRLGFKPLYWGEYRAGTDRSAVLFASEVRVLLGTGLFPRRIDSVALHSYAWNGFVASPRSIVEGIQCVQPGKCLSVRADTGQTKERRYWFLPDYQGGEGDKTGIGDALRRAVERQVRCHLPVGFFLSGGIDSSAVAALASELSADPIHTFNVAFDDAELDESPYARAVAKSLGTDHSEIRIDQRAFEEGLEAWLSIVDQPTFDGLNTFLVSRAVRGAGIRVALGGTGADDLFGGNRTFTEIPLVAKWSRRFSPVPTPFLRSAARLVTRLKTGRSTVPHQARWGKLADVASSKGQLLDLYQLTYALFTREFLDRLLLRPRTDEIRVGLPRLYADELESAVRRNPELYAISLMELYIFLGERLLRDLDCASESVGLQVRVPFLDDDLIEVWRGTSPAVAYEPLGRKKVLLDTALARLDSSLFERPKAGFVLPVDRWCRDRLGSTVERVLTDAEHCRAVGIDPDTSAKLWLAFKRADSGLYWSRIWSLFVYLRLCKREGLELQEAS